MIKFQQMIRLNGVLNFSTPLRSTYRYPSEFEIQHTNRPTDIILFQTKFCRLAFEACDFNHSNDALEAKNAPENFRLKCNKLLQKLNFYEFNDKFCH